MEEYYEAALTDVEKDTWGPNLKTRDSDTKIIFLHEFKEHFIVPDCNGCMYVSCLSFNLCIPFAYKELPTAPGEDFLSCT